MSTHSGDYTIFSSVLQFEVNARRFIFYISIPKLGESHPLLMLLYCGMYETE